MNSSLSLLSRLWLREPDAALVAEAREAPVFSEIPADPSALASAYTELFLMNVYPYGSVWTDPSAELNASSASELAARYEQAGFAPAQLLEVAAPDHVGLCLAFLEHLGRDRRAAAAFAAELLDWVPFLAIAVCRDTSAHPFYRALAGATAAAISAQAPPNAFPSPRMPGLTTNITREEEIGLAEVLGFLLSPARSGFFLSRSRLGELAREAGLALSFGSRFDVARSLLLASGQTGAIPRVLDLLEREVKQWEGAIEELARELPAASSPAALWRLRLVASRARLGQLRESLDTAFEVLYEEPFRTSQNA